MVDAITYDHPQPNEAWEAASSTVRNFCGWHVTPVIEETLVLDGEHGCDLLIPSNKVVDITRVTVNGVDVTERVQWSEKGILRGPFRDGLRNVEVDIKHGHEYLPDVNEIVQSLVARSQGRMSNGGGAVASQSVGGASVRYGLGRDGAALGGALLISEKESLAPYVLNWGP